MAFSPDGRWLASGGIDGTLRLWPLTPGAGRAPEVLQRSRGQVTGLAFVPDGRWLLFADQSSVRIFDLVTREQRVLDRVPAWPVAVSPDGRTAAAGLGSPSEHALQLWDIEPGESRRLRREWTEPWRNPLGGWNFMKMEFSADGRHILTCGFQGVLLWSLDDGSVRDLGPWMGATLSRDGRTVFRAGRRAETLSDLATDKNGEVGRLDLETGSYTPIPSHGEAVWVALDPTETRLVTIDFQGRIRVGPVSGEDPHVLLGHEEWIQGLDLSPDGRWIATGGDDGTVRLWEVPPIAPPIHTLPREQLLEKLDSLTSARVVADPESPTGYRSEWGPFPGWTQTPSWWPRDGASEP